MRSTPKNGLLGVVQEAEAQEQEAGLVGPGHDDDFGGEHEPVGRLGGGAAGEQVDDDDDGVVDRVAAEHHGVVRGAGPRPAAGVRVRGAPGRHQRLQPRAEARRGRVRQRLQGLRPPARCQRGPHRRRRQAA